MKHLKKSKSREFINDHSPRSLTVNMADRIGAKEFFETILWY